MFQTVKGSQPLIGLRNIYCKRWFDGSGSPHALTSPMHLVGTGERNTFEPTVK